MHWMLWTFLAASGLFAWCVYFSSGNPLTVQRWKNSETIVMLVRIASIMSTLMLTLLLLWQTWEPILRFVIFIWLWMLWWFIAWPMTPREWRYMTAAMTVPTPPAGYSYPLVGSSQLWSRNPLTREQVWRMPFRRKKK